MTTAATWMTVADAAALLGCSTRTIDRRVARGQLQRQDRDGRVFVAIPESMRRPADRMIEAVQADAAQLRAVVATVSDATEKAITVMRAALTHSEERAAASEQRAMAADRRASRAWWVAAAAAAGVVGSVTVTAMSWRQAEEARSTARQLTATMSEATARAKAAEARADATEAFTAFLLGSDTPRQVTDSRHP